GAGEAGDGEGGVGQVVAGQELDGVADDEVVLGPEPQVVHPVVGQRVVVAVPVVDQPLLDGRQHLLVQPGGGGVAPPEPQQPDEVHEVEVPGVLPGVDLGEHVGQRVHGDGGDVPLVVRLPGGPD